MNFTWTDNNAKNRLDFSETIVFDNVEPDAPTIDYVDTANQQIVGEGVAGDTVTVTFPSGAIAVAVVGNDGKWAVEVPDSEVFRPNDLLKAQVTDNAYRITSGAEAQKNPSDKIGRDV